MPRGTLAHYRRQNDDGSGFHIREYANHYELEWDRVDPKTDLLAHLVLDMKPKDWGSAATGVGVVAAAWVLRKSASR